MFRIIILSSMRRWDGSEDKVFSEGDERGLAQYLIQLFFQFQEIFRKIRGSPDFGRGICLGSIPQDHHRGIILHVLSRKLRLEFNDFIVDYLYGPSYGAFILGFYPDTVGAVAC